MVLHFQHSSELMDFVRLFKNWLPLLYVIQQISGDIQHLLQLSWLLEFKLLIFKAVVLPKQFNKSANRNKQYVIALCE